MTPLRLVARPLLASSFVLGGIAAFRNAEQLAPGAQNIADRVIPLARQAAPSAPIPEDPVTLVRITGVAQVLAGLGLALGKAPRLSSGVLAATLVPSTLAAHRFWEETDEETRNTQKRDFVKNLSLLGGLLIASGDTAGKPGLAWRTRHAAVDARQGAQRLAHTAKREARLAVAERT